jgi:hypothetical protein
MNYPQGDGAGAQNTAVILTRLVNVLWRSAHLAQKQRDGRSLIAIDNLSSVYFTTYPSAAQPEFQEGLTELVKLGEAEVTADCVLFDLSKLG